jgi:hypothetical protein
MIFLNRNAKLNRLQKLCQPAYTAPATNPRAADMSTPNPVPTPAASLGQTIDADVAALKARVAALEGDASAFWTKQITWLKANWPHLVTWATSATIAVKLGVLADIAKIL